MPKDLNKQLRRLARLALQARDAAARVDRLAKELRVTPEEIQLLASDPFAYKKLSVSPATRAEYDRRVAVKEANERRRKAQLEKEKADRIAFATQQKVEHLKKLYAILANESN